MSFPFNHHHTHHRNDEQDTPNYPPPGTSPFHQPPPPQPQPPFYGVPQPPPPRPPHETVTEVYHTSHVTPHGPDNSFNYGAFPPSDQHHHHDSSVRHVSHEAPASNVHHLAHVTRHPPQHDGFSSSSETVTHVHHVSHQSGGSFAEFSNKRTVKVVTKADPNYSLTVRNGKVILAYSDPTDEYQHWYKDEKWSTRVKDEEGCPAFSLVNKVTGEAIKHSIGATHPVRLIPYNQNFLDESILWTESRGLGDGHRAIRMVNNIRLNVDAYHGDKHSGGVHDGTTIVLWEWNNGDNQHWKIVPY